MNNLDQIHRPKIYNYINLRFILYKYATGFGSRIKETGLIMCVHFNIVIATHKFTIFSLKLIGLNFLEGSDSYKVRFEFNY